MDQLIIPDGQIQILETILRFLTVFEKYRCRTTIFFKLFLIDIYGQDYSTRGDLRRSVVEEFGIIELVFADDET